MAPHGSRAPRRQADAPGARFGGALLIAGGGVIVAATHLTWLGLRAGDLGRDYAGVDVPVVGRVVLLLATAVIAGGLVEAVVLARWPVVVPAVAGAVLAVLTAFVLVLAELVGSLLPSGFLPTSAERASGDVHAGIGTWAALAAAAAVVALGRSPAGPTAIGQALGRVTPVRALTMASAATVVVVATWCRYEPWVDGSVAGRAIAVSGSGLPWVGPASLAAVAVLAAGAAGTVLGRGLAAPLVAATAGWALSFASAVSIVAIDALGRVDAARRVLPDQADGAVPLIGVADGAWIGFGAGLAAAAGAVAVLTARVGRPVLTGGTP